MNPLPESGSGKEMPAKKPESVVESVMAELLVTANKSAASLAPMGLPQCMLASAAKACAKAHASKIMKQALSYARKLSKTVAISPEELLEEIAHQSGVKLTTRKHPARKKPAKKGGHDGRA